MTLEEMMESFRAAERRQRDEFQVKYPHYTPPPWAGISVWDDWVRANEVLHGIVGFRERFPKQAAINADSTLNGEARLGYYRLWATR